MALLLAIETSGAIGSAAVRLEDGSVVERVFPDGTTHGTGLFPACEAALAEAGRPVADVEVVAVSLGPGSFTGLRVGVAAAKGLAFALGADLVGVSTLDALAHNAPADVRGLVVPVLDARRGHVHAALYSRDPDAIIRLSEDLVLPPDRLAARLESPVTLLGDGVRRYPEILAGVGQILPEEIWCARAAVVAEIAARDHAAGRRDAIHDAEPLYRRIPSPQDALSRKQVTEGPAG